MAGPRAPIGTLSQHAAAAAGLVRGMVPKMFTRTDPKRARKGNKPVESDSDSSSDSDTTSHSSGSDSETDEAVRADTKAWREKMEKSKAASALKSSAGKSIKPEAAPVASLKAKGQNVTTKPAIKKRQASDSSASESESEGQSDDEGDKMAIDPKSDSESDSSDVEMVASSVKRSPITKTAKKAPSTSASEASSASETDSSDEESASASKAKPTTKAAAAATKEISSSDEESALEGESDDEDEPKHPIKRKAAPSVSDSESESEEEPEPPRKTKAAKEAAKAKQVAPGKPSKASASVNGTARSKETVSESDSSSAEQSDSGSESEDAPESMAVEKRAGKTAIQPPREIISQGFHLRQADEDVDAAAVARAFKQAKAEGKQIWYFTTPKSVPIEVIQKHAIPLDKVHAGKSIFAHEGAEFTAHFEEPVNSAIKVLIPGKTGRNYETLNQSVDRVMHITRVTRFGQESESESAPAAIPPTVVTKAPRPQPKGLKARYQAFGVANGGPGAAGVDASDDEEDVEMIQAPPLLTESAADPQSDTPKKAAKKRKHGDVEKGTPNKEEAASTPVKKSKKARVDTKAVESSAKAAKQTPIVPPPIPSGSGRTAGSPEPTQASPVKKSKSKDKSKKKDSVHAEKSIDSKKPPKSMSERRKALEAARSLTPSTPTKSKMMTLTPVPIPGIYSPRKVTFPRSSTLQTPNNNAARPNGTPTVSSRPPLKSILKTPEREQYSSGKTAHSGGRSKSSKKKKKTLPWLDTQGGQGSR